MTASERETERVWRFVRNLERRMRRRQLYRSDPIWRLTKLKDNRERRLRERLKIGAPACTRNRDERGRYA